MDYRTLGLKDWKRLWRFRDQASRNLDLDADELEHYELTNIKRMVKNGRNDGS